MVASAESSQHLPEHAAAARWHIRSWSRAIQGRRLPGAAGADGPGRGRVRVLSGPDRSERLESHEHWPRGRRGRLVMNAVMGIRSVGFGRPSFLGTRRSTTLELLDADVAI